MSVYDVFFGGGKKKKSRRDEYEDDSGLDSEEDDPVERARLKRLSKTKAKPAGRPAAAVERRLAVGGASSWHYLFQAPTSLYKRFVYGKNWSNASAASLNAVLSSAGMTLNKAAALWLQSSGHRTGPLKTLMMALRGGGGGARGEDDEGDEEEEEGEASSGEAESLLACVALSYAAEAMPGFASGRAAAAADAVMNPTHDFETPFHWEMSAEERETMWEGRGQVAAQQLVPSLKAAAKAVRAALQTGDDATLRAALASINFPST